MKTKRFGIFLLIVAIAVAGWIVFRSHTAGAPSKNQASSSNSGSAATGFNKNQYSLTDPSSIWVIVNKSRPLSPKTYTPTNLVVPAIPLRSNITSTEKYVSQVVAGPLETMVAAAKAQDINLNLQSGYRSYSFQVTLYNGYVSSQGQSVADTQSARPGFSEHQTGLAVDLGGTSNPGCNVAQCFASTAEGEWLAANAYKYGFIIRYTADKQAVTGYEYEPWHVRYVGAALSNEMHAQHVETLEEFFGTGVAPDY